MEFGETGGLEDNHSSGTTENICSKTGSDNVEPFIKKVASLTPWEDDEGIIRGGGRLPRAFLSFGRKYPILIPKGRIGDAFLGFVHASVALHQGRLILSSSFRMEGYYPVGGRRRISNIINACVICKKLRAKPMT